MLVNLYNNVINIPRTIYSENFYNHETFVIDVNFGTGYFGSTAVSSAGTSSTDDDSVWEFDCPTGYYGINTKNINTYG